MIDNRMVHQCLSLAGRHARPVVCQCHAHALRFKHRTAAADVQIAQQWNPLRSAPDVRQRCDGMCWAVPASYDPTTSATCVTAAACSVLKWAGNQRRGGGIYTRTATPRTRGRRRRRARVVSSGQSTLCPAASFRFLFQLQARSWRWHGYAPGGGRRRRADILRSTN